MADASMTFNGNETNGNGRQATALAWEPESPFMNTPPTAEVVSAPATHFRPIETPFASEYHGDHSRPSPQAEDFASLMDELRDEEFDEALEDLVDEAGAVVEEAFSGEIGDPQRDRVAMERAVRNYLQPLEVEAERMLDRMSEGLAGKDLGVLNESEVDSMLESFASITNELPPAFEGFLGSLVKKAKKAVKGALKVAKKVASVVAAPHMLVLGRLKGLVRPILERVLRMAIDRLPVAVRPIASQLARRFLGIKIATPAPVPSSSGAPAASAPIDSPSTAGAPTMDAPTAAPTMDDGAGAADATVDATTADPATVQEEMDARLVGYMLAGETFDESAVQESFSSYYETPVDALQSLDSARQELAGRLATLDEDESAAPAVEQFLPAILPALKLGLRIVGRRRVVRFLAGLVARFIARYVGQAQAKALSTALVDTGLKLINLESPDEREAAGQAIASTVEDTVTRLVQRAPASAWESEALLEAYAHEAFQEAASAHFPDRLIRAELHESANASGVWAAFPATAARKSAKKYSRVIELTITRQTADAVRTFGGRSLRNFLRDRMGVQLQQPVKVRVHLYEAIPGTRLSLIALHERGVAGLGTHRRGAWSLFHPLTPEAAGLLLNEPGLGRTTPPQFLVRRRVTAVGQRFYYLEIPGARVRIARRRKGWSTRPARSSQPRLVIDFVKRQLRTALYYSEADAQEIAKLLRQKAPVAAILAALKSGQERQLSRALAENPIGVVRIVHEVAPTDEMAAPIVGAMSRVVGPKLADVAMTWLLDALKRELESRFDHLASGMERAAQADEDGVTIRITFDAGALVQQLRRIIGPAGGGALTTNSGIGQLTVGSHRIELVAGFAGA
jgi:hypothetical protein